VTETAEGPGFTAEEVCEQARGNAGAGLLALLAYARAQGQPPAEAARFVGRLFAPGWDDVGAEVALVAARWAALNLASCGAEVRRLTGDAESAEATVVNWPPAEDLAFFGLTREEADAYYALFAPIAERLGLRFAHLRVGGEVTLAFERAGVATP
jgi:hypothetical protein